MAPWLHPSQSSSKCGCSNSVRSRQVFLFIGRRCNGWTDQGVGPPKDIQCQEMFPSPWDLQLALKKLKRGKVPGQNQLPPDILKAGAAPLCHQLLCAHYEGLLRTVKSHWSGRAASCSLFPRGSQMQLTPLHIVASSLVTSRRRWFHMTMRNYLVRVWEKGIQSLQLGGRKHMGVDFAHHFLQAHRHWTAVKKIPSAYLFFDIKSAFYSVLRQALFPDDAPPLHLIAALSKVSG